MGGLLDVGGGLSPHVRGNQLIDTRILVTAGPIPARTGEPSQSIVTPDLPRAYPRTYGGTPEGAVISPFVEGLSPHVRGNRHRAAHCHHSNGPIPVRTGEPYGDSQRSKC